MRLGIAKSLAGCRAVLGIGVGLVLGLAGCVQAPPGGGSGAADGGAQDVLAIDPAVDHFKGDLSAPNVIIEYGNFLCSHCGSFFANNLPDVLALVDEGRAVLAYRHLVGTEESIEVAQAAECAAAQDEAAFFPYHDLVFSNQGDTSMETLRQYAVDLNLDPDTFDACLDSADTLEKVARDVQSGLDAGANATPTFLVNGQLLVGNVPVEDFEALFLDE